MPEQQYYRRSLDLLRRDKGWVKPLLVLTAASLVPFVGALGVYGYVMEWARLTAWGVDSSPKQKNVKVGECIKSGWRAFLVSAVPVVVVALVINILSYAARSLNIAFLSSLVSLVGPLINLFVGVIALICALHATVYQDIKAGFAYQRITQMLKDDMNGIVHIAFISVLINVLISIITGIIGSIATLTALTDLVSQYRMWGYSDVLNQVTWVELLQFVASFFAQLCANSVVFALTLMSGLMGTTFAQLIMGTAAGLWMREFNVPSWGAYTSPAPRRHLTQVSQLPEYTTPPRNM